MRTTNFAEFEVKETTFKIAGDTAAAARIGCVGKSEESLNQRVITKKCEGVVKKKKVRGDGTGELKMTLHMGYQAYGKSLGMYVDGAKDGVLSYGTLSIHKAMCITQKVYDEEGDLKYKAYPNCIVESGVSRSIENGAEEVAEIELTLSLMPDEYGQCMYEAVAEDMASSITESAWMTNFTSSNMYSPS